MLETKIFKDREYVSSHSNSQWQPNSYWSQWQWYLNSHCLPSGTNWGTEVGEAAAG